MKKKEFRKRFIVNLTPRRGVYKWSYTTRHATYVAFIDDATYYDSWHAGTITMRELRYISYECRRQKVVV